MKEIAFWQKLTVMPIFDVANDTEKTNEEITKIIDEDNLL